MQNLYIVDPHMLGGLQELANIYKIKVGGDFTSSAPIGGTFIQGNTSGGNKKNKRRNLLMELPIVSPHMLGGLQDLDTIKLKVGGDFTSSAPIGGTFIQGNTGGSWGSKGGNKKNKRRNLMELSLVSPHMLGGLQDLGTTIKLNVGGNFDSSAPIGGTFIQGNTGGSGSRGGNKKKNKRRNLMNMPIVSPNMLGGLY